VRVLLGSTAKMGVGTNVQTRLTALHHLDAPWRPCDVEQREGRILRQGNLSEEVEIFRYVTEAASTVTCGRRWRPRHASSPR
jgi:SNF2 family DNA or RNA helicase